MKKLSVPALLFFFCALFIHAQQINVTLPKAGKIFNVGSEITVLWSTAGLSGNVRIVLRRADGSNGYVIKDQHPATQVPVKYTIPNFVTPGAYFVRIKQGTLLGESGHFTIRLGMINTGNLQINRPPNFKLTIPVTSPTGGSHYKRGDNLPIRWNKIPIDNYSKVHIFLYSPDGKDKLYTIGSSPPSNTGQFNWAISHVVPLRDYVVKVSTPDGKVWGNSNVFSVSGSNEKPSITTSFYPHINNPAHRAQWNNGDNECLSYNQTLPLATPPYGGIMRVGYRARIGKSGDCRWHDWDFFRGFLIFDITQARGVIKSATLSIKMKEIKESTPAAGSGVNNNDCTSQVEVFAVQGDWSVNSSGYQANGNLIGDFFSTPGQRKNIDVTQWVQDAMKGNSPYKITFMVKGPDTQERTLVFNQGDTWCAKYYKEIYLTIVYVPYF